MKKKKPIVPGTISSKDESGVEVDVTMFKQAIGSPRNEKVRSSNLTYGVSLITFHVKLKLNTLINIKENLRYLYVRNTKFSLLYKEGEW